MGVAVHAGEKVVYSSGGSQLDLPVSGALSGGGFSKFDFLDRKSSLSGVGALSLPAPSGLTRQQRDEQFLDLFSGKKDWIFRGTRELNRLTDPEVVLGVSQFGKRGGSMVVGIPSQKQNSWDSGAGQRRQKPTSVSWSSEDSSTSSSRASQPLFAPGAKSSVLGNKEFGHETLNSTELSMHPLESNPSLLSPFLMKQQRGESGGFSGLFGSQRGAAVESRLAIQKERAAEFRKILEPNRSLTDTSVDSLDPINSLRDDTTMQAMTPVVGQAESASDSKDLSPWQAWQKEHSIKGFEHASVAQSGLKSFGSLGGGPVLKTTVSAPLSQSKPGVLEWPKRSF
jgi:hypothetical protein